MIKALEIPPNSPFYTRLLRLLSAARLGPRGKFGNTLEKCTLTKKGIVPSANPEIWQSAPFAGKEAVTGEDSRRGHLDA